MNTTIEYKRADGKHVSIKMNGIPDMEYLAEFLAELDKRGGENIEVTIHGY